MMLVDENIEGNVNLILGRRKFKNVHVRELQFDYQNLLLSRNAE